MTISKTMNNDINVKVFPNKPKSNNERNYSVFSAYKIANFIPDRIHDYHQHDYHRQPYVPCKLFTGKFFKNSMLGYTFKQMILFLTLFAFIAIIIWCSYWCENEHNHVAGVCKFFPNVSDYGYNETNHCDKDPDDDVRCKLFTKIEDLHKNMVKVLGFMLGFYTATIMTRWWSQISNLPSITDVAMILQSTVISGKNGNENALLFKKKILRYCCLSWTMLMTQVSSSMKTEYGNTKTILEKGLATKEELLKLNPEVVHDLSISTDENWLAFWWIPLNWCCQMIRDEEHIKEGNLPRHGKEITNAIIKFKNGLLKILEYTHHPLPAICSQAVHITCWFYLVLSALSGQAWCCHLDKYNGKEDFIWIVALVFAAVEKCILVSLMFAWLKMADICNSAFDGGDTYYDIELMDELEWNIWFASLTLLSERVPTLEQS